MSRPCSAPIGRRSASSASRPTSSAPSSPNPPVQPSPPPSSATPPPPNSSPALSARSLLSNAPGTAPTPNSTAPTPNSTAPADTPRPLANSPSTAASTASAKGRPSPNWLRSCSLPSPPSPTPRPSSPCPRKPTPLNRRGRRDQLMPARPRLLHWFSAPPAVASDAHSACGVFVCAGLSPGAPPALERPGKALRVRRALPGVAVAGGLGNLHFRCSGGIFRLGGGLRCGGHRRRQGRLAAGSRTARPPRPCRLRTPPGLDPARAGRHPQLFRRLLERRLAGTFPANFVLPPPLRQGHAHFRLSAAGAAAPDERAGGVLSRRDAGSL